MAQRVTTTKRLARERVRLVDLDQRPELASAAVAAFAAGAPGKLHLVCGLPASMGQVPTTADLTACLGVVLACSATELLGAVALCPYSDEQVTLWGPASSAGLHGTNIPERLLTEARRALKDTGYTSVRTLVDHRNRELRAFFIAHGFVAWKDNVIFERSLRSDLALTTESSATADDVRLATTRDHTRISSLFAEAFPETGHLVPDLATREREGYRHYVLPGSGTLVGAAAVVGNGRRRWLKLIGVATKQRAKGHGQRLLAGIIHHESALGAGQLGLEVLGDNAPAVGLYVATGFKRQFTATIMTAPL